MGSKLSGSLIRNEHDVTVLDLNSDLVAEKVTTGAKAADNGAQLMRDCDAVITCLPSPAASNAVMQEMLLTTLLNMLIKKATTEWCS